MNAQAGKFIIHFFGFIDFLINNIDFFPGHRGKRCAHGSGLGE